MCQGYTCCNDMRGLLYSVACYNLQHDAVFGTCRLHLVLFLCFEYIKNRTRMLLIFCSRLRDTETYFLKIASVKIKDKEAVLKSKCCKCFLYTRSSIFYSLYINNRSKTERTIRIFYSYLNIELLAVLIVLFDIY